MQVISSLHFPPGAYHGSEHARGRSPFPPAGGLCSYYLFRVCNKKRPALSLINTIIPHCQKVRPFFHLRTDLLHPLHRVIPSSPFSGLQQDDPPETRKAPHAVTLARPEVFPAFPGKKRLALNRGSPRGSRGAGILFPPVRPPTFFCSPFFPRRLGLFFSTYSLNRWRRF